MKTYLTLLSFLLLTVSAVAQTGKLMNRYYISGSLAVGKNSRVFADSSSWIDIGADTTTKGVRFPQVLLDSIHTSQRALFVYDLEDSVLYHFDGDKRVRYLTHKDAVLFDKKYLAQGGNAFGTTIEVGSQDDEDVDIVTNGITAVRVLKNGNVNVGSDVSDGDFSMYINGVGDNGVLHLHRGGQSTFIKTTTNNDNAYTHILAIGRHRIKTKGYGISFSADDNEDEPEYGDLYRIKNVNNSAFYNPFKVLGANNEPYFTIGGLGGVLIGTNSDNGHKLDVYGSLHTTETISVDVDNQSVVSKDIIKAQGSYHPVSAFNIGLNYNDAYIKAHNLQIHTGESETPTLAVKSAPPSAGSVLIEGGVYNKVDLKGGILGEGWKLFVPEGIWSYQHTSFPFQPIEFTGNSTNQGIVFNTYSATNALQLFGTTGNVGIGNVTVDDGHTLDVNGNTRVTGNLQLEGSLVFKQPNKLISIVEDNSSYQPVSINIGRTNTLNTNDNGRHITIGNNNTGSADKIWQYMIGQGNNLSGAQLANYAIGDYNTIASGDTYQFIYGSGNTINYPWSSTSRGVFIIGSSNGLMHRHSSIMGNNQTTTAENQLIFADANSNSVSGGFRDVYFGTGPVSNLQTGIGAPVTINSSGGKGTDKSGGLLRLAAGKGTGAALPTDVVFATTSSAATGTTLQTLTDRWFVKGETGYLSNNNMPTALLDLDGATGYDQLRIRHSYTPTSSADVNGNVGDVSWDDDYIYIKTSTGWKRSTLTSF